MNKMRLKNIYIKRKHRYFKILQILWKFLKTLSQQQLF